MAAIERLSAGDLAEVVRTYRNALKTHRAALNRLNVYPVPDGDTGTNMSLTVESVQQEVEAARADGNAGVPFTVSALAHCLSHGSLMGARGNSGVILSQVLRGMSGALSAGASGSTEVADGAGAGPAGGTSDAVGPRVLAEALERASEGAYAAVSNPVEGTILTVARAAAEGAAVRGREPRGERARGHGRGEGARRSRAR